jgi:very-short-patch-repair endonuclease
MPKFSFSYDPKLIESARELRENQTPAERKFWFGFLRDFRCRMLRQRPIGPYIVDFYCAQLKIVIEVDGNSHYSDEAVVYDQKRTEFLQGLGLRVLRFTNSDVLKNFDEVCKAIERFTEESPQPPLQKGGKESPQPPLEKGGKEV